MTAIAITLTDAGKAALANAAAGGAVVRLTQIGLTAQNFVSAPTLVALPGEFVRLPIGGRVVSASIVHMTAEDTGPTTWLCTGLGIYRDDGTLFGVYDHPGAAPASLLLQKAAPAVALIAFDLVFQNGDAALVQLGPMVFAYPPATEAERGVAEIATQPETDAGVDDQRIVTPKKLAARLAAFFQSVNDALAALNATVTTALAGFAARRISAGGVATGGGDFSEDRTITVTAASPAQVGAMAADDVVLTPHSIGGFAAVLATNGYIRVPAWFFGGFTTQWGRVAGNYSSEGTMGAVFPTPFVAEVFDVSITTTIASASNSSDFWVQLVEDSINLNGFSAQRQSVSGSSGTISGFRWRAIGR